MDDISSATDSRKHVLLPPEVLQLVLQHVDLPQRLGPCALVCRAWRAAANAATNSVSTDVSQQHQATALTLWLQRHGSEVAQLQVQGTYCGTNIALPCHHLSKLDTLEIIQVTVCPADVGCGGSAEGHSSSTSTACASGSGSPGPEQHPVAALTRLTQLCLDWVRWPGSFQPLSTLTNLRDLHLHDVHPLGDDWPGSGTASTLDAAVGTAVSHLVQLTSLLLGDSDFSDASIAHISRLQQLQVLQLYGVHLTAASMATVPLSLTWLMLRYNYVGGVLSCSTTPALAQLTALQHLDLREFGDFEPALLSHMAQLTHLRLCFGNLLPAGSAGAAALLAAVARMTQLQHLELESGISDTYVPAAAYAALTASSHLTQLRVLHYARDVYPLPAAALNHMFTADRQFPVLQEVNLVLKHIEEEQQEEEQEQEQEEQQLELELELDSHGLLQQGFDRLLQCCPGLRSLELMFSYDGHDGENQPPIKLHGLLALSGLTRLALQGLYVDDGGITSTLAQLTGLRQLTLLHIGVSNVVLLQLTTLQRLERLGLHTLHDKVFFHSLVPPGSPSAPDVWQQLQVHCVSSCKECAQQVLQQKDAQLQGAQAQLAAQQAQHEAQLAEARQQLAEARLQLEAQHAQHQAQLAQLARNLQ